MKNTIIQINGIRLSLDFSAMTPTAREKWFKDTGAQPPQSTRKKMQDLINNYSPK
jgi:hypothetical protein